MLASGSMSKFGVAIVETAWELGAAWELLVVVDGAPGLRASFLAFFFFFLLLPLIDAGGAMSAAYTFPLPVKEDSISLGAEGGRENLLPSTLLHC